MNLFRKRQLFSFFIALQCILTVFLSCSLTANAEPSEKEIRIEANKLVTVESNEIENWPQGPVVSARSAILIEANTGAVLYAKNIHDKLYPASITKILTAYIARQKGNLNDMVEYSTKAVNSINWREDANIGIKPGEALTLEQSLYSLLVGSANECGNAIGEHISGSMEDFAVLMNETAKELGCTDSNFVTTNGIHDENHYTSVHDMALIAQKFFDDDLLCRMSNMTSYTLPVSPTLSQELLPNSKNQLFAGRKYAYENLVGSKTGYTDIARQNLVSCAQKDGLKLICVVMQDEAPMQYTDTVDLFNYGFSNFKAVNISQNDTTYSLRSNNFFVTGNDIFGNSDPILSLDEDAYVVIPAEMEFENLTSELSYENLEDGQAAMVHYTYEEQSVGKAAVQFSSHTASFDFDAEPTSETAGTAETENTSENIIAQNTAETINISNLTGHSKKPLIENEDIVFLNIKKILFAVLIVLVIIAIGFIIFSIIRNNKLKKRRRAIMRRRRRKKNSSINLDRYIDRM